MSFESSGVVRCGRVSMQLVCPPATLVEQPSIKFLWKSTIQMCHVQYPSLMGTKAVRSSSECLLSLQWRFWPILHIWCVVGADWEVSLGQILVSTILIDIVCNLSGPYQISLGLPLLGCSVYCFPIVGNAAILRLQCILVWLDGRLLHK